MGSSQGKGGAKDSLSHGFELSLLSDNFRFFFARLNLHGSGIVKYFAVPGNLRIAVLHRYRIIGVFQVLFILRR